MRTYDLVVSNRAVRPNSRDMTLVRTSVGIDEVHVLFDDAEWLDFPVTITFASGADTVTQSLVLSEVDGSEYVAEASSTIPWEVIDETGRVRVTIQGTDSQGRHIITAKGAPLSVIESGDVDAGEAPQDAPTVDEWRRAYADAMQAVNQAASLVVTLRSQLDEVVAGAETALDERIDGLHVPATRESLGEVIVGSGLDVAESGELYVTEVTGITAEEQSQIRNLASLAYYCFDTEFDESGVLSDNAKVKASALPVATAASPGTVMPDGVTISVGADGLISLNMSEQLISQIADAVAERLSQ